MFACLFLFCFARYVFAFDVTARTSSFIVAPKQDVRKESRRIMRREEASPLEEMTGLTFNHSSLAIASQTSHQIHSRGMFALETEATSVDEARAEPSGPFLAYSDVPGRDASNVYRARIAVANEDNWVDTFVFLTRSKAKEDDPAYFDHLEGWTHSWTSFEFLKNVAVVVEIFQIGGTAITSAAVHPAHCAKASVSRGKAYVTLTKPCQCAVDINGQMDGRHTGKAHVGNRVEKYNGPPINAFSIFANPTIVGRPDPDADNVLAIAPGTDVPESFSEQTLYFLPGVHKFSDPSIIMKSKKRYYIPGDSVVHGLFKNKNWGESDITIFGYGIISGEDISWKFAKDGGHNPVKFKGAIRGVLSGVTIVDPPYHSVMGGAHDRSSILIHHIKILGWRANGDGVHIFKRGVMEDCFFRTQDDSMYIGSATTDLTIRRMVVWNDANGASFIFSASGGGKNAFVEDCDVIYSRASWDWWSGGRVFNLRNLDDNKWLQNITVRNIRVTDPFPTLAPFILSVAHTTPNNPSSAGFKSKQHPQDAVFKNILFQNIKIVAPNVADYKKILIRGDSESSYIRDIVFDNVVIGDKTLRSVSDPLFDIRDHVHHVTVEISTGAAEGPTEQAKAVAEGPKVLDSPTESPLDAAASESEPQPGSDELAANDNTSTDRDAPDDEDVVDDGDAKKPNPDDSEHEKKAKKKGGLIVYIILGVAALLCILGAVMQVVKKENPREEGAEEVEEEQEEDAQPNEEYLEDEEN